jgi:hypothetical protein
MEILNKLLKMQAKAFTVEELKFLINLDIKLFPHDYLLGKEVEKIYNRLRGLPMEQGGIEGGYQF